VVVQKRIAWFVALAALLLIQAFPAQAEEFNCPSCLFAQSMGSFSSFSSMSPALNTLSQNTMPVIQAQTSMSNDALIRFKVSQNHLAQNAANTWDGISDIPYALTEGWDPDPGPRPDFSDPNWMPVMPWDLIPVQKVISEMQNQIQDSRGEQWEDLPDWDQDYELGFKVFKKPYQRRLSGVTTA